VVRYDLRWEEVKDREGAREEERRRGRGVKGKREG